MLVSDLDDDPGDLKSLAGVSLAYRQASIPVRIVALNPQPRDAALFGRLLEQAAIAAAGAPAGRALPHDRRIGPAVAGGARGARGARARRLRAVGGAPHLELGVIRTAAAVLLLVAAALAAAVAVDAGRWEHSNGERPHTLAGRSAEHLLGAGSDVALRKAVRTFIAAERVPYGFDNGQAQARARAEAQSVLADVASTAPGRGRLAGRRSARSPRLGRHPRADRA